MNRRAFLLITASAGLFPTVSLARDRAEQIVADLTRLGFTRIETGRTFLGRTRIVATGPDGQREIVVHPRTGEVLRDVWEPAGNADIGGLVSTDDDGGDDDNGDDNGGDGGGDDNGGGDDGGDGDSDGGGESDGDGGGDDD